MANCSKRGSDGGRRRPLSGVAAAVLLSMCGCTKTGTRITLPERPSERPAGPVLDDPAKPEFEAGGTPAQPGTITP